MPEQPKAILIVDSDGDTIEILDRAIRDRGYRPLAIRRGAQMISTLRSQKPAAVIMDISLADRDGGPLIRQIKDDWEVKKIPIVIHSGYPNRLNRANFERVEGVFEKPADPDLLLDLVQRAIRKAAES
ncbi:MAG: response regulator [Chloroflexi bacterium]|nr:response regulator [Chloroflexota bacterium]